MSQENVEIVRRWNDAYNRRDFETLIELTDPDFEFKSLFLAIESVFRGYDGLRAYFKAIEDAYDRFEIPGERYFDAGAAVLVECQIKWRGKGSGAQGATPVAVAAWIKTGRVFHLESYTDLNEGLEAVGLSEQDAHADS
jgi:ketosteroid isomerase-like protein